MTVLISAAMWILGIKYFMIIGIISGIANLIPYIGSIAAFVLSVVAAAAQGTTNEGSLCRHNNFIASAV